MKRILILFILIVFSCNKTDDFYKNLIKDDIQKNMKNPDSFSFEEFYIEDYSYEDYFNSKINNITSDEDYIVLNSSIEFYKEKDSIASNTGDAKVDFKQAIKDTELILKPYLDRIEKLKDSVSLKEGLKFGKRIVFGFRRNNFFGGKLTRRAEAYFDNTNKLTEIHYLN